MRLTTPLLAVFTMNIVHNEIDGNLSPDGKPSTLDPVGNISNATASIEDRVPEPEYDVVSETDNKNNTVSDPAKPTAKVGVAAPRFPMEAEIIRDAYLWGSNARRGYNDLLVVKGRVVIDNKDLFNSYTEWLMKHFGGYGWLKMQVVMDSQGLTLEASKQKAIDEFLEDPRIVLGMMADHLKEAGEPPSICEQVGYTDKASYFIGTGAYLEVKAEYFARIMKAKTMAELVAVLVKRNSIPNDLFNVAPKEPEEKH